MTDHIIFSAYNSVSTGVFVIDHDYKIVHWNNYMEKYTGIKADAILKKYIYQFFPAFKSSRIQQSINDLFEWGTPIIFSSILHKDLLTLQNNKNISDKFFEVNAIVPDNENLQSIYAVFTVEDVTGLRGKIEHINTLYRKSITDIELRIRAEAALRERENELKQLNTLKDQFISILAHDIRNQIGGSTNFMELLIRDFEKFEHDVLKKHLQKIYINILQAFELLELLLKWGQNKLKNNTIAYSNCYLSELVDKLGALIHYQTEDKKVKLINEIPEDIQLETDADLLSTIIRNIVLNAIKYSEPGGKVFVQYENTYSHHKIIIQDNGIGMDVTKLNKLFKQEIESSQGTSGETGSGIGLFICKEFVDLLSGTILAESELDKGTRFYIKLPKNIS